MDSIYKRELGASRYPPANEREINAVKMNRMPWWHGWMDPNRFMFNKKCTLMTSPSFVKIDYRVEKISHTAGPASTW